MTWSFASVDHRTYNRNPLVSTDVELRFHPIVKIEQSSEIASFQDLVRGTFPIYKENRTRKVAIGPTGDFAVSDGVEHVFAGETETSSIVLTPNSMRISCIDHKNREELIGLYNIGLQSLSTTFGGISRLRLGVRYVNIIDIAKISEDLAQSLEWKDLIEEDFLRLPNEIASVSSTSYTTEVRSNVEGGLGGLSLRYGLQQNQMNGPDHFRFDIDRFIEFQGEEESSEEFIALFTQDIFSLFHTVVGNKLKEWMEA